MQVFKPLPADHHAVNAVNKELCARCHNPFQPGERTMLVSLPAVSGKNTTALLIHATCALEGLETEKGIVARIKDGDASPYPVVMEDGTQATFEECGIDAD